jgi:hypothetical protein
MNQKVIFLSRRTSLRVFRRRRSRPISARSVSICRRTRITTAKCSASTHSPTKWVQVAVQHVVGLCEDLEKLADINSWFANPGYRTDDEGRYLSYLGHTVSVRSC